MVELSHRLGLTVKPGTDFIIGYEVLGQELESHPPMETGILGQKDLAHTAGTNPLYDAVLIDYRTDSHDGMALGSVVAIFLVHTDRRLPPSGIDG
jgi:hypothetical protein